MSDDDRELFRDCAMMFRAIISLFETLPVHYRTRHLAEKTKELALRCEHRIAPETAEL